MRLPGESLGPTFSTNGICVRGPVFPSERTGLRNRSRESQGLDELVDSVSGGCQPLGMALFPTVSH